MSSTDEDDRTLPAPPTSAEAARPSLPRWSTVLLVVLVLVVAGYLVLTSVHVGYFVQSPGSTVALEDRLAVEGAPSYPSDGEVHFTTVRLSRDRASLLDVIGDWLDPASVLVDDDHILQGRTADENRAFNQDLMENSHERAKRVALEYLGLDVVQPDGALISQVQPDTPAEGILEAGDVVTVAGGRPLADAGGLVAVIDGLGPGDEIELDVRRLESEEVEAVTATLGEHPDEDKAFLGVAVADSFALTELPFEIDIDTRAVGGPSAGLALTLSIIDLLTEGELTGGLQVATTGTIDVDGVVGPVGGVEQKAHAVRRAGIDVFIVPGVDAERARSVLGESVVVVAVDELADAIEALGNLGGDVEALALPAELRSAS